MEAADLTCVCYTLHCMLAFVCGRRLRESDNYKV